MELDLEGGGHSLGQSSGFGRMSRNWAKSIWLPNELAEDEGLTKDYCEPTATRLRAAALVESRENKSNRHYLR